jgi:hypothetical protein
MRIKKISFDVEINLAYKIPENVGGTSSVLIEN